MCRASHRFVKAESVLFRPEQDRRTGGTAGSYVTDRLRLPAPAAGQNFRSGDPLVFVSVRSLPVKVGRSMGRGDIGVWGHMPIVTTTNSAAANDYGRQIGEHHCLRHSITTATSPLLKPQNATV